MEKNSFEIAYINRLPVVKQTDINMPIIWKLKSAIGQKILQLGNIFWVQSSSLFDFMLIPVIIVFQRNFNCYIWLFFLLSYMFVQYFCNWRSAEIILSCGLGQYFESTVVWTMVWNSCGQWSDTCLIRDHFSLELVWSEAASSTQWSSSAHSSDQRSFGLGRSDHRSHLSRTVWSEITLVWDGLIRILFERAVNVGNFWMAKLAKFVSS